MSENGSNQLSELIQKAIEYVTREFDMHYGEIVGVLEMVKTDVIDRAMDAAEASEDTPDDEAPEVES